MVLRRLSNHYQHICSNFHRVHLCPQARPCIQMAVLRGRQMAMVVDMVAQILLRPRGCRQRHPAYQRVPLLGTSTRLLQTLLLHLVLRRRHMGLPVFPRRDLGHRQDDDWSALGTEIESKDC
jgi:hypothetical protein